MVPLKGWQTFRYQPSGYSKAKGMLYAGKDDPFTFSLAVTVFTISESVHLSIYNRLAVWIVYC
jgi:hypothetical protein